MPLPRGPSHRDAVGWIEQHRAATAPAAQDDCLEGSDSGALAGQRLWTRVLSVVADDTARLVAYLSFVRAMKAPEIQARHSDRFQTVADVYRTKFNIVERLRRDIGTNASTRFGS